MAKAHAFEDETWMEVQEVDLQKDLSRRRNSYLASKIGHETNMAVLINGPKPYIILLPKN